MHLLNTRVILLFKPQQTVCSVSAFSYSESKIKINKCFKGTTMLITLIFMLLSGPLLDQGRYLCNTNNQIAMTIVGFQYHDCQVTPLHYNDGIMRAMASQITSLTIIYSTVYSGAKKTSKLRVTGLCEGNSPVTGEFPAQTASNAVNVSIWWRHHDDCQVTPPPTLSTAVFSCFLFEI